MHPIENIIESSMDRIKKLVDANTVIGDPISADGGTLIIPVSKISIGFALGGGEYGAPGKKRGCDESGEHFPFTGASTVGLSLKPTAFLSVEQGNVRIIPAEPSCTLDKLSDLVPQLLKGAERLMGAALDNRAKKCENKVSIDFSAPTREEYCCMDQGEAE